MGVKECVITQFKTKTKHTITRVAKPNSFHITALQDVVLSAFQSRLNSVCCLLQYILIFDGFLQRILQFAR